MATATASDIEARLVEVTKIKPNPKETRAKFLARLVREAGPGKLSDEGWAALPDEAQRWVNWGAHAIVSRRKLGVYEFDALPAGDPPSDGSPVEENAAPVEAPVEANATKKHRTVDDDDFEEVPVEKKAPMAKKAPKAPVTPAAPVVVPAPVATALAAPATAAPKKAAVPKPQAKRGSRWSTPGASSYWRELCILHPDAPKRQLDIWMEEKKLALAPGSKSVIRHEVRRVIEILAAHGRLKTSDADGK